MQYKLRGMHKIGDNSYNWLLKERTGMENEGERREMRRRVAKLGRKKRNTFDRPEYSELEGRKWGS